MTTLEVLDLPMRANDADADTVRDYLVSLLAALWEDGESFSGKQPLGNSGWQDDLYYAVFKAGLVEGTEDEFGFNINRDATKKADQLIDDAIEALRKPVAV